MKKSQRNNMKTKEQRGSVRLRRSRKRILRQEERDARRGAHLLEMARKNMNDKNAHFE